jgi:hypothetical protein
VHTEIGLDHDGVRPGILNQFVLADDFAGAFYQYCQYVQRAAANADWRIAL